MAPEGNKLNYLEAAGRPVELAHGSHGRHAGHLASTEEVSLQRHCSLRTVTPISRPCQSVKTNLRQPYLFLLFSFPEEIF